MDHEQMNGDWRELWRNFGPKLLLFARQQTPDAGEADDIVQEAFVRYWKSRNENPDLTPTLLFTLVKRISIDYARKREHRKVRETQAHSWTGEPCHLFQDRLENQERTALLEASLKTLPGPQREVLVLKIWGDLTFDQVGQALDISPNTAASRYRYALNQLRQLLTPSFK